MKVFKKVFALAVIASAFAISTSAFAASVVDGKVVVPESVFQGLSGQTTIAVVDSDFGEEGKTSADLIHYIDQNEAETIEAAATAGLQLKAGSNAYGNYEVRVGNVTEAMRVSAIPQFTVENTTPTPTDPVVDEATGTSTIGFPAKVNVETGSNTISKVVFTLHNGTDFVTYDYNVAGLPFANSTFTIGLEIQGIPNGITVSCTDVQVQ